MAYKGKRGKQQNPLSGIADKEKLFWSRVDKRGRLECWEWQAGLSKGYGMFWDGKRRIRAHVYSFECCSTKSIPENMDVLHACGNRRCVNPTHLYLGTDQDNADDRDRHLIQDMMGIKRCLTIGKM